MYEEMLEELKELRGYFYEDGGIDEFSAQTFMNDYIHELVTLVEEKTNDQKTDSRRD